MSTDAAEVGRTSISSNVGDGIVAEICLDHDRLALRPTLRRLSRATIVPESRARYDDGRTFLFVSVRADSFATVETAFASDTTVRDPVLVDRFPDRRVYRVELTDTAITVAGRLAEVGGRVLEATGRPTGWTVQVRLPSRESLIAFNDSCKNLGVSVNVTHLRSAETDADALLGLTAKQQELLTTAYEEGYFDVPRGISQDELAARFGVSKSAVSQRLRRATAELCEATLVRNSST